MKHMTEGRKMFWTLLTIFFVYGVVFILFEDIDRYQIHPLRDPFDWHLLWFSLITMSILAIVLHRYAQSMDRRISKEQAEKEACLRRELTQNISHELKTPVASIQGYLEMLLHNKNITPEQQEKFLERCLFQTHRLTALLQDISTLNRMDYAAHLLEQEDIDIVEIINEVDANLLVARQQQEQTFTYSLPPTLYLRGNRSLLVSIFQNLLDNSIKYAGHGVHIELSAVEQEKVWKFTFRDDGVGISPRHSDRIFERFYRIGKGRSRNLGGTGLGLAVVKNAVTFHGGKIELRPTSSGTIFIFTLKK